MPNLFWALIKSPHSKYGALPTNLPRLRRESEGARGALRAIEADEVLNSDNAFMQETTLDEIAFRAELDPLDLRRRLMAPYPAAIRLIDAIEVVANWKEPPQAGTARGFAFKHAGGTWIAAVVDLSEADDGVRIDRVVATVDPGYVRDENGYCQSLAAAVRSALAAAVGPGGTIDDPEIVVELMRGPCHSSGRTETVVPPVGPALANAVFALTGRRVRSLPVGDEIHFV